jgi:hypothetical protein
MSVRKLLAKAALPRILECSRGWSKPEQEFWRDVAKATKRNPRLLPKLGAALVLWVGPRSKKSTKKGKA